MRGRSTILGALLLVTPLLTGGRLLALDGIAADPGEPASWTFYVENDSFLSTDRYYTNGIRLTRSYGMDGLPQWAHTTRWMERIVSRLPRCSPSGNDGNCYNYEAAWTFGQNLYTPDDIRTTSLISGQRPYGAWLYYGNILTWSTPREQQSLEIDIGAVGGSWALGEEVQSGWHSGLRSLKGSDAPPDPAGWDNQIRNQPGLQLTYRDRWRLLDRGTASKVRYFDLVPAASVSAGTVSVQGSVGAMARLGYNLADEFPEIIPSLAPSDPADLSEAPPAADRRPALLARPVPARTAALGSVPLRPGRPALRSLQRLPGRQPQRLRPEPLGREGPPGSGPSGRSRPGRPPLALLGHLRGPQPRIPGPERPPELPLLFGPAPAVRGERPGSGSDRV